GVTGKLVKLEQMNESPFEAVKPDEFAHDLAREINALMADPALRDKMAAAGRKRVEDVFSWKSIAHQTVDLYKSLIKGK
ncbi:MAG TPA: glycosyltransferase, partial [Candidatus Rifleibacterium sp.]|nr:glycosyltransferase [Candidatus Rifleibacterium sp.]